MVVFVFFFLNAGSHSGPLFHKMEWPIGLFTPEGSEGALVRELSEKQR